MGFDEVGWAFLRVGPGPGSSPGPMRLGVAGLHDQPEAAAGRGGKACWRALEEQGDSVAGWWRLWTVSELNPVGEGGYGWGMGPPEAPRAGRGF